MSTSQAVDPGNHSQAYHRELSMPQTDTLISTAETEFNELVKRQISKTSSNARLLRVLEDKTPGEHAMLLLAFMELFENGGDTRFLECIVTICEHGLDALPESIDHDAQRSRYLDYMLPSQGLLALALEKKEMHDDAIDIYERAVKAAPDPRPLTAELCILLARALQRRFNQLSKGEDLDKAISTLERAVACTSADDSLRGEEQWALRLLSELLGARWRLTKDKGDLDLLVGCATQVVTLDPSDPRNHYCLGRALLKLADASTGQDTAYLSDLLQSSTIPLENLAELEEALSSLFCSEHDVRSLDHVVATCEHAIERYPDHDQIFDHLCRLGLAFKMKALDALESDNKSNKDLDNAIDAFERAVDVMSDLTPLTVSCFGQLGVLLSQYRSRLTLDVNTIDRAIWALEMAINCSLEHEQLWEYHIALSQALENRWGFTKDQKDLDCLVASVTSAVMLNPNAHANYFTLGRALLRLDNIFIDRLLLNPYFVRMADASAGQDKVYLSELLQSSTIPLENLADLEIALVSLSWIVEDIRALDLAVATCEYAVSRYPDHDSRKFEHLYRLGDAFEQKGSHDSAIHAYERAVDIASDLTSLTCKCFGQLGLLLRDRFRQSQDAKDRDRAKWALEMAVACSLENERETYDQLLSDFLEDRWDFSKDVDDLERMVTRAKSAVELNPNEPTNYMSLRDTLEEAYCRYTVFSASSSSILSLIDSSIVTIRNLLPYISETSSAHARALCTLGLSYLLRTKISRGADPTDVRLSVACFDKAETIQRLDVKDLINQGLALIVMGRFESLTKAASIWDNLLNQEHVQGLERFRVLLESANTQGFLCAYHGEDEVMLDQAIQAAEDACHSLVPRYLQIKAYDYLGDLLARKVEKYLLDTNHLLKSISQSAPPRQPPAALEYLISIREKVLSLISQSSQSSHAYQVALIDYGSSLYLHARLTLSDETRRRAMSAFRQAAAAPQTDIGTFRNTALIAWATCAGWLQDWSSSMEAFRKVFEHLEDFVWLGLSTFRQIQLVSGRGMKVRELGSCSATFAVFHGSIPTALEWLDQCRSVAWQKILNLRVSSARLAHVAPDLALRLQTVSQTLGGSTLQDQLSGLGDEAGYEAVRQQQHRAAEEWKHLINKVRSVQGFGSFLRPKTAEQLSSLDFDGYVVVLNVQPLGCDAFILRGGTTDIQLCRLNRMHIDEVIATSLHGKLQRAMKYYSLSRGDESRASKPYRGQTSREIMAGLLSDLWDSLVKPILDFIRLEPYNEGSTPPRLWWCPNGPLAFLPLHAAGLYDTSDRGTKVYEYVASSYTPTVSMLADKLDRQHPIDFKGLLAVSQPSGDPPIPKTVEEAKSVVTIARHHDPEMEILRLNDVDATAERVLNGMATYSWIHLACHASQNLTNPLDSAFLLSDRSLKLSEIATRALPHAELAFLSACQTATGDAEATDEAVHLAAGMLVIGFRSVVATMWSVRDSDAPIVADAFYQRLFSGGKPNVGMSGIALHHATMALRESVGAEEFMSWVPFVHFGV
ncbi:hypothetical protein V5O48_013740 [Marasmius crinis-equi]|uniref:CHAT domain-containing protein n=1 Tax=Marasmius crinis-equi TaxID=585013 RepID=A0ABR3EZ93_9AGAR